MGFKEQYFAIWQQGWGLHKKYHGIRQQDEERWKQLNDDCQALDGKYGGTAQQKFIQSLLLAIIAELERNSNDAEGTGTTTTTQP